MDETPTDSLSGLDLPPAGNVIDVLLRDGKITAVDADQARRRQRRANSTLEDAILELGTVSPEVIFRAVAEVHQLPYVDLFTQTVDAEAIKAIPAKVVLHYKFLPISLEKGTLTAAFSTPPGSRERQNLRLVVGVRLRPVIAPPQAIARAIKQHYGLGAETVMEIRKDRQFQDRVDQVQYENSELGEDPEQNASVLHLFNQIIMEALEMQATDMHIEPFQDTVRIRYRIDGLLREIPTPPGMKELHSAIVSRAKIMSNLNIAEHRLPHDGRTRVTIGDKQFDLRVSILPTRFGETLNMRILNTNSMFLDLAQLGLEPDQMRILSQLLEMPHGMILVTGPTGSGKSTTLYASLEKTNKSERKVITVEDPVEYQMEGISQIQMHASIGLTFARGLRSILRHDPDIILVGEIRDAETAEIAIRSALTGHLVLSTLHTNDSVGAVNRLCDMGIEPFLVASSLSAAIAQRLVRRICPHCRVPDTEIPDRIRREIADTMQIGPDEVTAFKGAGCSSCDHAGYRGRLAIYEFFLMNEDLESLITRGASTADIREMALKQGMKLLRQDGWCKVTRGATSIEEVLRITTAFDMRY